MKFVNYLKNIENVSVYPAISLALFMTIFILVVIYVFTADKKRMDDDGQIPLH